MRRTKTPTSAFVRYRDVDLTLKKTKFRFSYLNQDLSNTIVDDGSIEQRDTQQCIRR